MPGGDVGRGHATWGRDLTWRGPAIGLLDLDAFFASVEQLDHPAWRGKPVIVGGAGNRRGVVSTASYEARTFGVHSAMPAYMAERLCPQAIWTRGHYDRYREVSAQVMAVLLDETPYVEQVSIDEAFFDVTPGRWSNESPIDICRRVQDRVADLGVTCSIGLSTTKTVAKIASDRDKPRGLTVVPPGTESLFLGPLPVRYLSGVGEATEKRLTSMGVDTLGQLAEQDLDRMEHVFGVIGPQMVLRARGEEHSPVRAASDVEEAKSVSNERTFSEDLETREELVAAIRHVSALAGARLRRKGLKGWRVTLKLRFDLSTTRTIQRQLPHATDDEHVFGEEAVRLLDEVWAPGRGVRLVGVGVSDFDGAHPQQLELSLGGTDAEGPNICGHASVGDDADGVASVPNASSLRNLSEATDKIRERFGKDAVGYGFDLRFAHKTTETAPQGKEDF